MKKILLFLTILTLVSCEDLLEKEPLDSINDANFWSNETTIRGYITQGYSTIVHSMQNRSDQRFNPWGHPWEEGTDNAVFHNGFFGIGMEKFIAGNVGPEHNNTGNWNQFYSFIQHVNTYLQKDENGEITVAPEKHDLWRGEMLFIRGWCFAQLSKRYGGIPIPTRPYIASDLDDPTHVRASYEETVAQIIRDLDEAAALLPLEHPNGATYANKAMALAVKARVLLYAASIYNNPGNDMAKWQAASDANKEVIDLMKDGAPMFSLYNPIDPGFDPATATDADRIKAGSDYGKIFVDFPSQGNTEAIISTYCNYPTGLVFFRSIPNTYFAPVSWGGWGFGTPTQDLVDCFQMYDGSPYDREMYGDTAPYDNREVRFYANILYDGAVFERSYARVPTVEEVGNTINTGVRIKPDGTEVKGCDGEGALTETGNRSRTGYYARKYVREDTETKFDYRNVQAIQIRLSEIYLNYAECQMELGNEVEARKYIEPIRTRVGLPTPAVIDMDVIRYERRVELVMEGHRFWDIRRWGILEETAYKDAEVCKVIRDERETPTKVTYEYSIYEQRSKNYHPKLYWFPIHQSEREKYPYLDQNPGY